MNILSDHVVLTIFGNIEQLMALNTELLIHLKSLGAGEAFCRLGPFLKLYSTYANNHERALAALMVGYFAFVKLLFQYFKANFQNLTVLYKSLSGVCVCVCMRVRLCVCV